VFLQRIALTNKQSACIKKPNVLSSQRFKRANGFNMKFTNLYKATLISAGIIAIALFIAWPAVISANQCQSLAEASAVQDCINIGQQSWYSWFQGKSRSTQFHFVDLLELLSRVSPAQKP
jgi:hypothetical protein